MISFLTPYLSGREMMEVHLRSIRAFYPSAPILVSAADAAAAAELEDHRRRWGVRFWIEDVGYIDAILRLLSRCETPFVCVLDHDVVLLDTLAPYIDEIGRGEYDLLGVEERIREPASIDWERMSPEHRGWLRYAPGAVACNFIVFDWEGFRGRWGVAGVKGRRIGGAKDHEYDYGIGQRLPRHRYLLPFHTARYGTGNVLMHEGRAVAWHQWFGAFGSRGSGPDSTVGADTADALAEREAVVLSGEEAFLRDYPELDLTQLTPAWGPGWESSPAGRIPPRAYPPPHTRIVRSLKAWRSLPRRLRLRLDRWRRR